MASTHGDHGLDGSASDVLANPGVLMITIGHTFD
jgi:hypothetical protein